MSTLIPWFIAVAVCIVIGQAAYIAAHLVRGGRKMWVAWGVAVASMLSACVMVGVILVKSVALWR